MRFLWPVLLRTATEGPSSYWRIGCGVASKGSAQFGSASLFCCKPAMITSAEGGDSDSRTAGMPLRNRLCPQSHLSSLQSSSTSTTTTTTTSPTQIGDAFAPKKVLVLTKFSRLEFEKRRHKEFKEDELIRNLEARGSDYQSLLHHHNIHTKNRDLVVNTLRNAGLETRLVDRFDYTDANVEWADVIFTTGGDGTFLMAASKVKSRDKPVIGINSDPSRSIGYLCLPGKYTEAFPAALQKLLAGSFRWLWRQRIRVSVQGEHAYDPPIELHDQQLQYPEYRFIDCINEEHKPATPNAPPEGAESSENPPIASPIRILPIKSLNEVFVGESLSSRVSYYEISIDGSPRTKVKSSGVTICTGTGSTSWSFNINKVTPQCVQRLLEIVQQETGQDVGVRDSTLVQNITSKFNDSLIFDPSQARMAYTIRDPVFFGTHFSSKPRGFAKRIEIRSRMFDACLVIDGSLSFVFNDGATAVLEILEQDALKTVAIED
ncbi:NAD kinase 2, mitochondrial isoform X2 [Galendromus occidentalis]|uniref:NAD kinase 2, mitochondrial n=1 Tax=Galendromus occidentalis TaxID=34638 RepID=A0AAJ7L486_9ACAR|nr:NAD kinase 2, mitochondrial isoform X2 [Galendromus occidentalis]